MKIFCKNDLDVGINLQKVQELGRDEKRTRTLGYYRDMVEKEDYSTCVVGHTSLY